MASNLYSKPDKGFFKTLLSAVKNLSDQPQFSSKGRKLPWNSKSVFQTRQDINSWKRAEAAYNNAEYPQNFLIQILFDEVLKDARLASQINNRIQQVLSATFVLKNKGGEVDEEATKTLSKHPLFRSLTKSGLDSIYRGYSLIELLFDQDGNLTAEDLPRTNIIAQKGIFLKDWNDQDGIKYREMTEFGTWILEYNSKEIGLINKAVSHVLFKRFAMACWSELCEIYGIPPRVMKTNTSDDGMLKRAEQMMQDMGSAAWFIIDEDESFEFADNVTTKGEVYQNLIQLCNDEMSMLISGAIVGQDTKNGSNAKEKASQDLQWYLVQDDMKLSELQWNLINLPALAKHGIIPDGLTLEFEKAEDITQLWTFTKDAMSFYDFDIEWLNNKFGLNIVESKKSNQQQNSLSALSFFLKAPKNGAMTEETCCGQAHTSEIKLLSTIDDNDLIKRYWDGEGNKLFDQELFTYTVDNLAEAFSKGWKKSKENLSYGIEYGADDPAALTAYEMNLFRFGGVKTLAESQLLNKAFRDSKSFQDFSIRASLITKIHNKDWLRTEYNTALSVGETSATYYRLKQQTELFPFWEYKTVDDNKVRPEHRLLDGLLLRAEDPIWRKIYPPNGWNCRCYVVPRLKTEGSNDLSQNSATAEAFTNSDEFKKAEKSGWGINRAETQEVFTANQQYITNITEANKLLSELSPADFKMKEVTNKPVRDIFKGDAVAFFDEKAKDNILTFTDYNNRKLNIAKRDFLAHSTEGKESRKEFLLDLSRILNNPDEVWFKAERKGQMFNQYMYIKYFEDMPVAIVAEMSKKGVFKLKTWFEVANLAIRWGLLIK
ncbi:DUF935 family protein [Pseudarcicella hirudinis]|uniref:phage portal protein family protein n=1 Tax=Pseudarcicella hirudinis TaxID=1079859 RepID=UPI0035F02EFF